MTLNRRQLISYLAASGTLGILALAGPPQVKRPKPPKPTPTPPPVGRDQLVPGEYFPDASNTGLLDPSVLTTQTGNVTYSTTTARVIENVRFQGVVYVTGSNIEFRNCMFEGVGDNSASNSVVTRYATTSNIVFVDCLFVPRFKSDIKNNLLGRGWTARRCEFRGAVDGCGAAPVSGGARVDVALEGCWIHDLGGWNTTSQADGFTHNDGIQWHGGLGLRLLGNRIEGFLDPAVGNYPGPNAGHSTSAIMINNLTMPGEMDFRKNWIDGGVVGINMLGVPGAFPAGANPPNQIIGNHFGFDYSSGQNNAIRCTSSAQVFTLTDNFRWFKAGDPFDTSTPFNVRVNG
jgi:hypothetical protein